VRDLETMSIALTAADTGHLVMTTLHTLNVVETITRIISFFPPTSISRFVCFWRARSRLSSASGCSPR